MNSAHGDPTNEMGTAIKNTGRVRGHDFVPENGLHYWEFLGNHRMFGSLMAFALYRCRDCGVHITGPTHTGKGMVNEGERIERCTR